MTTNHVLEQLPLWIEGDLSAQASDAVQAHLADCPTCHATAERLRTSQLWLKEAMEPPFEASDLVDLRQNVMGQLRQEQVTPPVRGLAVRPTLLAACAAVLLVAGLAWRQERTLAVPAPAQKPVTSPIADAVPLHPDPSPVQLARIHPGDIQARIRPKKTAETAPSHGLARLEFQIPDSNIRIIWLAQATPLPDQDTTPQEAL
jgi:anti-sigma factor RsiW